MRLTPLQLQIIQNAIEQHFGKQTKAWLFGSQVNDNARGGDIDLYLELDNNNEQQLFDFKLNFLIDLHKILGDQKIDVVIRRKGFNQTLPIYQIAKETGIQLL
jgi:predicted nucleotidyltransferase